MNEKNDLNDILIKSNEKSGRDNFKNIILLVAAIFLIFVIGLLGFELLSDDKAQKDSAATVLPPEPPKEEQQALFEDLPVDDMEEGVESEDQEAKESLDAMIRRIKSQKTLTDEVEEEPAMDRLAKESLQEEQLLPPIEEKILPKLTPTKKVEKKVAPKAEKPIAKKVAKKVVKPKRIVKKPAGKSYYAQVASLTKYAPNKKFLKSIKSAGYEYRIVDKDIKGMHVKRVYVGPFASRADAKKELGKIRAKISASA